MASYLMSAQLMQLITIGPWDFNGFDVVVLIILLISMLYAASRGLLREVISIAALLVAAIATLFVWGQFRFAAQDFISPPWLADGALLVGVFFIAYLIMVLIMSKIGKTIAGKETGFVDRILGAGFGIARGLIIASLGVMVLTAGNRASAEAQEYKKSLITQGIYNEVLSKMPKSMRDQMEAEPKPIPDMLANSTFYPLLNKVGAGLRALPFAKVKTYAERIKDGDIDGLSKDLLESGQ
jgi:membrane protein required for colicin V production